jgi:hypothetical protein
MIGLAIGLIVPTLVAVIGATYALYFDSKAEHARGDLRRLR